MMGNARLILGAAFGVMVLAAGPAAAADPVKIGVIYPLSGNAASAGQSAKDAVELGAEIVNGAHSGLGLPLAETTGLPNLGGAKIALVNVDHQGNPSVGQSQTLRLITRGACHRPARRLPLLGGAGRDGRGRALWRALPGRRFGSAQHHPARLQMGLPGGADRARFRQGL